MLHCQKENFSVSLTACDERNFIENKYVPGLLTPCPGLLHVTVKHNLAV